MTDRCMIATLGPAVTWIDILGDTIELFSPHKIMTRQLLQVCILLTAIVFVFCFDCWLQFKLQRSEQ